VFFENIFDFFHFFPKEKAAKNDGLCRLKCGFVRWVVQHAKSNESFKDGGDNAGDCVRPRGADYSGKYK